MTSKNKNKKRPAHLAALGLVACLAMSTTYASAASSVNVRQTQPNDRIPSSHNPQAMFERIDANSDGYISQDELDVAHEQRRAHHAKRGAAATEQAFPAPKVAVRERGANRPPRDTQRPDIFARLDTNNDGQISKPEWDVGKQHMKQARAERRMAHHRHDRAHGERSRPLRDTQHRQRWSPQHALRAMDQDNDGRISQAEWLNAHEKMTRRGQAATAAAE